MNCTARKKGPFFFSLRFKIGPRPDFAWRKMHAARPVRIEYLSMNFSLLERLFTRS